MVPVPVLSPIKGPNTVTFDSWSQRSCALLKIFLDGLTAEPDIVPGAYPGDLKEQYRINKVVYRFFKRRNVSDSGMYLFSSESWKSALFFSPNLLIGRRSHGGVYGEALLNELGVPRNLVLDAGSQIMEQECEVVFVHSNDGWRIDSLTLL